jgi:GTP cyclohydrolase I
MDREKIIQATRLLLEGIGEDPTREGLIDTPLRVAKMYEEVLRGTREDSKVHLSTTFPIEDADIMMEKNIQFYSLCEHHLLPFFGKVHIAYIPDGHVTGLSKLVRTVDTYSRRLQLQERMTAQIANAVYDHLRCQGVYVIVEAEHMCMNMRGVNRPGTVTKTVAARGRIAEDLELRKNIIALLQE